MIRRTVLTLAWLLLGTASGALGHPVRQAGSFDQERSRLLALEQAWDDAVARKDGAALEEILADDFVNIGANGAVSNKRQAIDAILAPEVTIEPFQTEDVTVRIYGHVAILTGRFQLHGTYRGEAFQIASRYTDVYVKSGGRWRAVTAQATHLPSKAG